MGNSAHAAPGSVQQSFRPPSDDSGDIQLTAISLSGKFVAFVAKNAQGRESLSVLELHSGNSHVIFDDAAVHFDDFAFSPDESYVYYRGEGSVTALVQPFGMDAGVRDIPLA